MPKGHGGGWMIRGTGDAVTAPGLVGVMTNGDGLILGIPKMTEGISVVAVTNTSEKLMTLVVTASTVMIVVMVMAV